MIILGGAHLLGQFLLDIGYIYIYIYTVRPVEIVPRGGPIFYLYIQRGKKVDQILGNFYYAF